MVNKKTKQTKTHVPIKKQERFKKILCAIMLIVMVLATVLPTLASFIA